LSATLLPTGTVVVGDLHLDPLCEADCSRLVDWLAELEAPCLVIVGDLFDAWVGPAHESSPGARRVLAALSLLTAEGTSVVLLHGNRDFLMGESLERATGARVAPEGLEGVLEDGTRVALIHGDELCTRDRSYQRLRSVLRSALVRSLAPRVPLAVAGAIARRLRSASVQAVAYKPRAEKEMQEEACRLAARERSAAVVVCGHAHRARDEQLSDGPRWVVLDAFGGDRDCLRVLPAGGLELVPSGAREPGAD
jgi:UDP-2,3-diacylglucosamine hydrolase